MPRAGTVTLACYDVAGRLLRTMLDGALEPGEYQMGIELEGRPAGVYYLRLVGPGPTLQRAFALMH